MGAVQSAYGYAQDLDKSLNNIRIVTGHSAEEMAVFAEQANKAAKALSATTTEYTNASLIYYQQGLSEEEVAKRTEVTVKMANVAGQSAEVVSDQLTAVWNNFAKGGENLEYYADVMTALGAATASSTDEIAGGLEKFAAVADTIGLSYEYAASALATITSNTRQSEEVVGTALKTIFARIQGLNLGETLDDGTTLNKYSQALEKVGISIFDSTGEMKKMDNILDEMAAKWDTLSEAQQAALAQTVAGVRQYTQLIALMDNWDSGDNDSMVANLETSYGASGALQEQADIYAEGWEASRDRVKASLEEIYSSLIDSDFFINLNDTFSKLLSGVSSIIDAMGGLKGVLGLVGMMVLKAFGPDLTQGINNALSNFRIFTGAAQADLQSLKKEAYDAAMSMTEGLSDAPGIQNLRESLKNTYTLQNQLTDAVRRMSPEQRAVAEEALKTAQHYNDIAVEAGLAAEKAEELYQNSLKAGQATREASMNTMQQHYDNSVGQSGSDLLASARGMKGSASSLGVNTEGLDAAIKKYSAALHDENISQDSAEFKQIAAELRAELDAVATAASNSGEGFKNYENGLKTSAQQVVSSQKEFEQLKSTLLSSSDGGKDFADGVEKAAKAAKAAGGDVGVLEQKLAKYRQLMAEGKTGTDEFRRAEEDLRRELDITHVSTEQATQQVAKLANTAQDGSNNVKVLGDKQMEQADAARQSALANTNAGEAAEVAGEKSQQAAIKIKMTSLAYQSLGSAFTGSLRAMASFAMGLNSLKSIQDTLNNTELTSFEKTTQVMMSLGMAIPALITGLKGVGNAFHFVFSAQKKGLTGQIAYLLGAKQEIATDKLLVIGKNGEVLARGKAGDAAVVEALKTEGATTVTKLDTAATWANIAAKMAKYWWIGLIIAALAALALIIYNVVDAYNDEANAAKRATERAKELKEAYEETKEAADNLKSSIDKYKDAKNAMAGLHKDTVEYKEALLEANEQALALLETYDNLAQFAYRNNDGLIVISDEGLDEILQQQYDLLEKRQHIALGAELDASRAQEKSDILNFARAQDLSYETMNELLQEISQYLDNNNLEELSVVDLINLDEYNNLTEEQQEQLRSNIKAYSNMGKQLISTNSAQEVLTDAYLEAAWRLNHPNEERDEAGRYSPEDIVAESLYETYANNYQMNEQEKEKAKNKFQEDALQATYEKYTEGDAPLDVILAAEMLKYSGRGNSWDTATAYAEAKGWDTEQTKNIIYDQGFFEMFTGDGRWIFKDDEGNVLDTVEFDDMLQKATDAVEDKRQQELAKIDAPEVLGNIDDILTGLNNNDNLKNLLYSGEKGGFDMANYQMSQKEASYWLQNWGSISNQFSDVMQDTGYWNKQGFSTADEYLKELKAWLETRSKQNDADAINDSKNGAGYSTADLKTTSDNVSAKVKNGDLTSANADTDVSYQNMVLYANDLLRIYPELTEAANTFTNAGLIGTKEWINAYDIIAGKINTLDAMAKSSEKLQGLKDKTSKDYTNFYEKLSPEEQILFAQLDINKYQSEEAIKAELARLQGVADENAIEVKISAIETAQGLLKEDGMTTEDWIGIRDSGIEWGKEGVIQFTEFLAMSYEEQSKYLSRIQADQNEALENVKKSTLANLYQDLQNLPVNADNYNVEYEAIQNNIQALEEELLILEKVNIAKELKDYEIDTDEYEDMAEVFRDLADAGAEGYEALREDEEAVKDSTVRYLRMNEAIEDLYDNYDDYVDVLKDVKSAGSKADKVMAANSDNAKALRKSLAGLLGTSEDLVGADLLDAIDPKDFEAAANGDIDAIERIREAFIELQASEYLAEDAIEGLKSELADFNAGEVLTLDTMPFLNSLIQAWVNAGLTADEIENRLSGMNIDADVTPFNEAMGEMVENAQTAGSAVVKSTSYTQEAEVVEEPTPNTQSTFTERVDVGYRREWVVTPQNGTFMPVMYQAQMPYFSKTVETGSETDEAATTAVGITTKNGDGESGDGGVIIQNAHKSVGNKVSSGNSSRPPVGTGSGGGSTPKAPSKMEKRDTTGQADVVERYREVNDAIDNVTDALTRAERATNRLWGKDKLDAMRQENKILAEQYKLLQQKAKEAKYYAKQDYNDLMDVADEIGVSVVVDTNTGDITNIEEVEEILYNRLAAAEAEYNRKVADYNAAVEKAGDSPTEAKVKQLEAMKDAVDAYEKDVIGGIEDDISAWEDAEQQFQDSVETWEGAGLEAEEILDQMMQKNFDIWSESLQLEVEVNDKDLELLDYYLSKIEDNVYEMAEAAALMVGNLNSGFEGGQLGEYLDNLSIYGERYAELTDRLNSTDPEYQITSAQYKEGLDEIQSGLLDNLSSIQELDNAMMNYYSDTLSMVNEEIDKYSAKMEHQTSILEHYATMMDILGKSQDYKAMGAILEGQVETIKNELDVAEAEYNLYAEEAEKKRKLYEEAVASGDVAAAELYKGEWEAAEEAAMEAQSNMLDKTEQWAEAMKAVVENKLNGLAKSLEEALTGGTSFDQINTQLERAASLQEEYLTTTNQIYETNKLMRTAQQEIDKSTNTVAKQRLKDFIKETDQLQDKSKLSKYELDIQKAKYDLLLAEIALEDAQNAKSTVRLQRDSEGNFGYVYTADQNQLSQAQQQLEDAQNSLYNIGLEGANNYTEKYNQTMQEMYDTLTSITQAYYSGEIASQEEYEAQMLAAQEYYYEQLQNFQDLYGVALQTDTRVIKDAWSTGMGAMKVETDSWKNAVQTYTGEATSTLVGWYSTVEEISNREGLTNIAGQVKTITDESKALKDTILGVNGEKGVVGALGEELNAVSSLTGGYAGLRQTIQGVIADYERMMNTIKGESSSQGGTSNGGNSGNGDTSSGSTSGNSLTGTSSDNSSNAATGKGDGSGGSTALTWDRIMEAYEHIVSGDWGNGVANRVANGKKDGFTQEEVEQAQQYINYTFPTTAQGLGYSASYAKQLMGFDTGGYTGEWGGAYGKMALLHQKELVLNEQDTANFLASMEVLERILAIIDLQSASAQLGGLLTTPSIGGNDTVQTIEQSVHIEASFPGVSDRNEIEEAFNNLINTASQYANRK